ncbi:MAG: single-stranded DNA-binding protein [Candidatus Competibacteraceae bacterium]|nr:single-stranded DNA-binding protein [Candidatus Competibacteraceae bacterium]
MFQSVTIIGHLGQDPEMRYTNTGTPVASFSVATKKSWTSADGQRQEKTVWFRVSSWQKQAEIVTQYLRKGSKVHVVGEIEEPRVFTDRDGNARSSLEMRAFTVTFLDSRSDSQQQGGPVQNNGSTAPAQQASTQPTYMTPPTPEDIPF